MARSVGEQVVAWNHQKSQNKTPQRGLYMIQQPLEPHVHDFNPWFFLPQKEKSSPNPSMVHHLSNASWAFAGLTGVMAAFLPTSRQRSAGAAGMAGVVGACCEASNAWQKARRGKRPPTPPSKRQKAPSSWRWWRDPKKTRKDDVVFVLSRWIWGVVFGKTTQPKRHSTKEKIITTRLTSKPNPTKQENNPTNLNNHIQPKSQSNPTFHPNHFQNFHPQSPSLVPSPKPISPVL